MDERFALKDIGTKFWTRPRGAEIRELLDVKLQALPEGGVLIIDLDGVDVFDVSFADELFVKTARNLQGVYRGRYVVLEHLKEHCRETLADKLKIEGQVMIEHKGDKWKVLGKVHLAYQQTIDVIAQSKKAITSLELSDILEVNLNAMNERLKKLSDLVLVKREKGISKSGKEEFLYSMVA